MEILEIQSSHNLMNSMLDKRPVGAHSYKISCHQFLLVYRTWMKDNEAARVRPLPVMTLGFERIWVTLAEGKQIEEAVQAMRSPVAID